MDSLHFGVNLDDGISGPARAGGASLEFLQTQLKAGKTALSGYQQQLSRANALGDIEGHRRYGELVAETKAQVYQLTAATEGATAATASLEFPVVAVAEAYATVGAAALAATVAVGALAVEGVEKALEVTNANDRMRASFEALGAQGSGSGQGTLDFLNELSEKLPQSRDQLGQWTEQYEALGITDLGELRHQLLATASAQAIMGDAGAEAYQKIQQRVQLAVEAHSGLKLATRQLLGLAHAGVDEAVVAERLGLTVAQLNAGLKAGTIDAQKFGNALSDTLVERGAEPLAAMARGIEEIKLKGRETFDHLFDGADTSQLTFALQEVISQVGLDGNLKEGVSATITAISNELGHFVDLAANYLAHFESYWLDAGPTIDQVKAGIHDVGATIERAVESTGALVGQLERAARVVSFGAINLGNDAGGGGSDWDAPKAPAHAKGGLVGPADGEGFASVAPGEIILPAQRQISGTSIAQPPQNDNGKGDTHVGHLEVHVHAAAGVTGAQELSVTGLTVALERLALASGR